MNHLFGETQFKILLAEDDETDIFFFKKALKDSEFIDKIIFVSDGKEIVCRLTEGWENGEKLPILIMMDINMPCKTGLEALADIKCDARFKSIPVIILSSSLSEIDLNKSYALGASCYVRKSDDVDELRRTLLAIEQFWLKTVTLPSRLGY